MTKLSIFLWLADSIASLNDFFALFAIFGIMAGVATVFLLDELKIPSWIPKVIIPLGIVCAFISCIIPSKKTIYMIAGVELANSVMQSDDFNKVKNYLGETGITMIDDIKTLIHAEAQDAVEKIKKEH